MAISPTLQGQNCRVGRVGDCPPSFWQNRRSRRPAAARHNTPHYWLPAQYLVASYAPVMYGYYSRAICNLECVSLVCILCNNIKFWNITCKLVILEMVVIFFQHSFLLFLNNFCPLWYFWTILVDPMAPHHVTKHLQPLKRLIHFRKLLLSKISLNIRM